MADQSIDPAAIEAEVAAVRSLGIDALRRRWRTMFDAKAPAALTKDLMARMIAYRIQEEAFGGLDRETVRLLDRLAHGKKPGSALTRRLKPGTVLVRDYQGTRHTVTIVREGFLWAGATYASLSTIARTITGTAWNGPRFFGLRAPDTRPKDGQGEEMVPVPKPRRGGRSAVTTSSTPNWEPPIPPVPSADHAPVMANAGPGHVR